MKIGNKLVLGFGAIILLMVLMAGGHLAGLRAIQAGTEKRAALISPLIKSLSDIRIAGEEVVRSTEEYDSGWMSQEAAMKEIEEKREDIQKAFTVLRPSPDLISEDDIRELRNAVDKIFSLSASLSGLHGQSREARAAVMEAFDEQIESVDKTLDSLYDRAKAADQTIEETIIGVIRSNQTGAILVVAISLMVAGGISFLLTRGIVGPLHHLVQVAEKVGHGDLNQKAVIATRDETGILGKAFNQMTLDLKHSYDEVQKRNEELSTMNEELELSNQELQQTTEELETASEEIRETQEKLVQQEKLAAVGQLASGVGHELRNPLGVLKNAVYFIKSKVGMGDEKLAKHLRIMDKEIDNATKIIADLLGFSRTRKPVVVGSDIHHVIEEALTAVEVPPNVRVAKEFGQKLPQVLVDPDQMRQVFLNLVLNGIQAMNDGGMLTISTRLANGGVLVAVRDTGCGIPRENIKKLFDPFFTTKSRGIGLGLAVSHGIVERNGGKIDVQSTVGQGSTFTVTLPVQG